jgi:hypothetical protein
VDEVSSEQRYKGPQSDGFAREIFGSCISSCSSLETRTRFWKALMLEHKIHTDDAAVYRQRVLSIAAGIPGELERLVKYHSSEPLVKSREVTQLGQGSVDREESGIAPAPILFALGAFTVAWRYIAWARGDLDADVLSGILVGVFMVARLALSRLLKSCSR